MVINNYTSFCLLLNERYGNSPDSDNGGATITGAMLFNSIG